MNREESAPLDLPLLAVSLVLLGVGLVAVFSASSVSSLVERHDATYYFKRQLLWTVAGLAAMWVMSRVDYHRLRGLALPALAVSVAGLVLVLLVGHEIGGSRRWIDLGLLNVQPSELFKLSVILFLAAYLSAAGPRVQEFVRGLVPGLAVTGLGFLLILAEPDFGTAVAMAATAAVLFFAGGARLAHLAALGAAALPGLAYLIWAEPYRMRRLLAFVDPWADPLDSGWNVIQSLLAIGSGGVFGVGLGQSRQKFAYLPEQHTDFIFAILSEEFGLLGSLLVVGLFFVLAWRGYRLALKAPDLYGSLLAVGITTMIVFQALLNVGVVTAVLPVTGITLPFISFGGSSLLITLTGVGILLNISRQVRG
ncbi:putative lipid II flippase FtsW [Limnochorda pilosa]|uniref:Probable peptidoglycan glycosyltransferase FtsW n=1 Tax=Limnochorda pilosa TaxID=1555112 RepID=A0A0K2SKS6_LIMPI|nr:putative lipid II flippase FtsW [Limnochorda pilosa]BAS27708.1 stage V sporulation protein E [Limnochorda pilosa]